MTYPNFKNKYKLKAFFSANDFIKKYNKNKIDLSPNTIIIYQKSLFDYALNNLKSKMIEPNLLKLNDKYNLFLSQIGDSNVATKLEELIEMGSKKIINLGTAGSLSEKLNIFDIVITDKAIRDEGVSFHYLKPSLYAYSSKDLNEEIKEILKAKKISFFVGPSWTISTPYRETLEEIKYYQKKHILTVEMENAAIFSVCKYRNIKSSSILIISDLLYKDNWEPFFHLKKLKEKFQEILNILIKN